MHLLLLVLVGALVGVTTAVFGFGGGFVAVPVIAWADHAMGGNVLRIATATSLVVMVGSALVATLATPRSVLSWLRHRPGLLACLAAGGLLGCVVSGEVPAGWVRWGFVTYIAVTFLDLVARRGFITRRPARTDGDGGGDRALPAASGLLIGAIATILGVGGSVMTVPALRRAGASMPTAAALANPLTLATVTPALLLTLSTARPFHAYTNGMVGAVDLTSAAALLCGAIPTILALRRYPLVIPDRVHATGYLLLLATSAAAVALS